MNEYISGTQINPEWLAIKNSTATILIGNQENRRAVKELPVHEYAKEIKEAVENNDAVIIEGLTGSGKTTEIPIMLMDYGIVAVTEPRRIAAVSVAEYVAVKNDAEVGQKVGFQIRHEDHTSEGSQVIYMTDGILLRKMQNDPLLNNYSIVMLDEAHERGLNNDILMGLLKSAQAKRKDLGLPPLKLVIASATIDTDKFSDYFNRAPVVKMPGKLYEVEINYASAEVKDYSQAAAEKVKEIIESDSQGDILIFMPGREDIENTIYYIEKLSNLDLEILPLYGELTAPEQKRIFQKGEKRRVIVSTNIAETSVTVPNIRFVIDSGLIKQLVYDEKTGISTLSIVKHSKSGSIQRSGRAGRLANGVTYRLYTESDFELRNAQTKPEILRSDLAHIVLAMKKIGIKDVYEFDFIDKPDFEKLRAAVETLQLLDALDEYGNLTEIGEIMADLPLRPDLARMVIAANEYGCISEICTIAAFIGNRSVFIRPKGEEFFADKAHAQFKVEGSDFLTMLNVWNAWSTYANKEISRNSWAYTNYLDTNTLLEVEKIKIQLESILSNHKFKITSNPDDDAIGKCITSGLLGGLMVHMNKNYYSRVVDGTPLIYIHPSSSAFINETNLFVAAEVKETSRIYARMLHKVKPEWLLEVAPHLVEVEHFYRIYDRAKDCVVKINDVNILIGSEKDSKNIGRIEKEDQSIEAVRVFAETVATWNDTINIPFIAHNQEILRKLQALAVRANDKNLYSNLDQKFMSEWYLKRLGNISTSRDLMQALADGTINLMMDMEDFMPSAKLEELESLSPLDIVINGRKHPVTYMIKSYNPTGIGEYSIYAEMSLNISDIIAVKELPFLPSDIRLSFNLELDSGELLYHDLRVTELEQLKSRASDLYRRKQWEIFRYTKDYNQSQTQIDVDSLYEEDQLPKPILYGFDPITNTSLFAYPAFVLEMNYETQKRVAIVKFFQTEDDVNYAKDRFNREISKYKAEVQRQKDDELLYPQVEELLGEVEVFIRSVEESYKSLGLSWDALYRMKNMAFLARSSSRRDPKYSISQLNALKEQITQFKLQQAGKIKTSGQDRIDIYWSMERKDITELSELAGQTKSGDIGAKRLAIAALASKGVEGVESLYQLIKSKKIKREELADVKLAVEKANTGMGVIMRMDLKEISETVRRVVEALDNFVIILNSSAHKDTVDYLGSDETSLIIFRRELYVYLQGLDELPGLEKLDEIVISVLEKMTS